MLDKTVLIIDDQVSLREAVAFEMEQLGFTTTMAEDGEAGFALATKVNFSLIMCDIKMPKWDGVKFVKEYRKVFPISPPVIFMTGFSGVKIYDAFDWGVDAFIGKPFDVEKLTRVIDSILQPLKNQIGVGRFLIPTKKLVLSAEKAACIAVGRRGFCFIDSAFEFTKFAPTDVIEFEISLTDKHPFRELKGVGNVIWVRNVKAEDGLDQGIGVEFKSIEPAKIDHFIAYVNETKPVCVIPKNVDS